MVLNTPILGCQGRCGGASLTTRMGGGLRGGGASITQMSEKDKEGQGVEGGRKEGGGGEGRKKDKYALLVCDTKYINDTKYV